MRFRGPVDQGYGRGGKKLGFPTANLPSKLFQNALQDVPTGVYFGWAVLEEGAADGSTTAATGRNTRHKAVVNVGFSPTFEGQENPEKIVEAHLIFGNGGDGDESENPSPLDPPDFYGETMRLQLVGFLRSEIKFPSFPDLIAQIRKDVVDAAEALDEDLYQEFSRDPFLQVRDKSASSSSTTTPWVGSNGGDATASWEFQDVRSALEEARASQEGKQQSDR